MSDNKVPVPIEELSVETALTESGLKGSVRSRFAVALDRLAGNLVDIPSVWLEAYKRRIEARAAVEEALIFREGEAAEEKMASISEVGDRVLDRFLAKEERRQTNQQAIAREALEELKALPPPPEAEQDNVELNDDWLNMFSAHAENASSERLRKTWGRVLAGEIRKPGSFSLSTLRFISEVDQQIATVFEKHARTRLPQGVIPKPLHMRDNLLLELTFLEEVGLLQEVHGFLGLDCEKSPDGYYYIHFTDIRSLEALFLRVKANTLRLEAIPITRIGREIAQVLPTEPPTVALEAVADQIMDRVESMDLCQTTLVSGDNISWSIIKVLKVAPSAT